MPLPPLDDTFFFFFLFQGLGRSNVRQLVAYKRLVRGTAPAWLWMIPFFFSQKEGTKGWRLRERGVCCVPLAGLRFCFQMTLGQVFVYAGFPQSWTRPISASLARGPLPGALVGKR